MKHLWFSVCLCLLPVIGDACPAAPDHADRLQELTAQLKRTLTPAAAEPISQELWSLWLDAPDRKAQQLLDRGMAQRSRLDFFGALVTFDRLIAYCPQYAEGYNQRAFTFYLAQDYTSALVDVDRAIAMIPDHVAALSGKGLILLQLDRRDEADAAFRAALAINPWLSERRYLQQPEGTEI